VAHLGILSLDTAFPRIVGDAGNPDSYSCDAIVHVVENADPTGIVSDAPPAKHILEAFTDAAQVLERGGARALVSTCGFLIHVQAEVAAAVKIPVMLSPLSLYSMVQTTCPGRIGLLTASAKALGPNTLAAANITNAAIAGMDRHALFRQTFLAQKSDHPKAFPVAQMKAAVLEEARALAARSTLSALILECGNLPPYAQDIRKELGIPVFTMLDAAEWLMRA
jgi:aspartate/glutamate racemase